MTVDSWRCNVCGAINHVNDGECQYCECQGNDCNRDNCSDPRHFIAQVDSAIEAAEASREGLSVDDYLSRA